MKLNRLIELHRQDLTPQDLADNFGDGVLVKNNRVYAKIREAALKAGYRFSSDPDVGYQALPFAQLEKILTTKTIPYVNNVSVIEALVAQLKDDVVWDDISDGLKTNFVFHESCHAVSRTLISPNKSQDQKTKAFRMLMEESFANTCELLAVADAEDTAHRIFLKANSYTALFEERSHIKNLITSCGLPLVFKLTWLAYLHSNYLNEPLDESQWRRCFAIAGAESLPAAQIKALKSVARIAFTLDPRFRFVTTRFHMKLNDLTDDLKSLLDFNFMADPALVKFLTSACEIIR